MASSANNKKAIEKEIAALREKLEDTIPHDSMQRSISMQDRQVILDKIRQLKSQLAAIDEQERRSSRVAKEVPDKTIAQSMLERKTMTNSSITELNKQRVKVKF